MVANDARHVVDDRATSLKGSVMKQAISTALAAMSSASFMASLLYSPALIWAILTLDEGWRWELLRPQIRAFPDGWHVSIVVTCLALAVVLCAKWRASWWVCSLSSGLVLMYWLLHGSIV